MQPGPEVSDTMNHHDECPKICIVGTNKLDYELLSFCLENEIKAECVLHAEFPPGDFSDSEIGRQRVWLFDCMGLDTVDLKKRFEIFMAAQPVDILVALFNVAPECRLEHFIRQNRIRGVFLQSDSRHAFLKGIRTILDGHLWLSRKMLSDCIMMPHEQLNP